MQKDKDEVQTHAPSDSAHGTSSSSEYRSSSSSYLPALLTPSIAVQKHTGGHRSCTYGSARDEALGRERGHKTTIIIQSFKSLFYHRYPSSSPISASLPARRFHSPFPFYYRCSCPRRHQDLGHQTLFPSPDWNSSQGMPKAMHSRADHIPVIRIQIL